MSPGLWVASTRGEFIGTVEKVAEGFLACDGHAVDVGIFTDLETAQYRITHPAPRAGRGRRRAPDDMTLARITAIVGGLAIVGSMAMLAAGLGA